MDGGVSAGVEGCAGFCGGFRGEACSAGLEDRFGAGDAGDWELVRMSMTPLDNICVC